MSEVRPEFILGRALAAWGNPPKWWPPHNECTRLEAEQKFTEFVVDVCRNWGIALNQTKD